MSDGRTQSVLFDLDGTLTDAREGIVACLRHALGRMGVRVPPEADLTRFIGPPLRDAFVTLLEKSDEETIRAAVEHYRERYERVGLYENRVYPRIPELLERIGAMGWRAYVATYKPTVFAERVLAHFRLRGHFAGVFGSRLDASHSRKSELIRRLLDTEGIAPDRTVMVGDRAQDIEAAHDNGLASVGVTYGYGSREELHESGASWICDDPNAVFRVLRTHFREVAS
jgi:phosphoglycolate phosphatase